jgi:AraC family transcriptional activator FtrA
MIDIVRDKPAKGAKSSKPAKPAKPATPSPTGVRRRPGVAHTVAIVLYDGLTLFELGVACDIFGTDRWPSSPTPWYRLLLCGATDAVTVDGGFRMQVLHGLHQVAEADTVIVLPTETLDRVPPEVYEALRHAHRRGRRIVSLCTGAFVLAEAGLLDGRRATTHWTEADNLARRYPRLSVDPSVLYIDDGDIMTSAGSAAGIDLCLHVIRHDRGAAVATQLARELVVPPQRDGGQAQYIDTPLPALDDSHLFADTVAWAQDHLGEPVTVHELAARAAMSPRTFARQFLAATGTTPYQWLLRQRVQLAQNLLERSELSIEAVAETSGFCTAGNLRKHFGRVVHTSPQAYRRTFKDRTAPYAPLTAAP